MIFTRQICIDSNEYKSRIFFLFFKHCFVIVIIMKGFIFHVKTQRKSHKLVELNKSTYNLVRCLATCSKNTSTSGNFLASFLANCAKWASSGPSAILKVLLSAYILAKGVS